MTLFVTWKTLAWRLMSLDVRSEQTSILNPPGRPKRLYGSVSGLRYSILEVEGVRHWAQRAWP